MATLDIFANDAFSVTSLSLAMVDLPRTPTIIGDSGLFNSQGISSLNFMIERQGSGLKLVPAAPRGAPPEPVHLGPRKLIPVPTIHLPQSASVLADEVQGVRAFGTETELQTVQNLVNQKLTKMRTQLDLTIEYQRLGAIKGLILDYDGTTPLVDIYDVFGMTQQTLSFDLDVDTTNIRDKIVLLKRMIQASLGGYSFTSINAYVGSDFFSALVGHPYVNANMNTANNRDFALADPGNSFTMPGTGVTFKEYAGVVNGINFIEPGEGYAFPVGIPDLFITRFAPADYMETVNTLGLPYYAKQELMKFNRGVEMESQSNPIHLNTRPEATIKLTMT